MQRRPFAVWRIDAGAAVNQPFHDIQIAAPGSQHNGRFAIVVHAVDVGPARQKQAHQIEIAFPGANHQAGTNPAPHKIRRQAGVQPSLGLAQVAQFHIVHKCRWRREVRSVRRLGQICHRPEQAHPDYHCSQLIPD